MGPFEMWAQAWKNGAAMMDTSMRMAETLHASRSVIDTRTGMIRAASADPLSANYRELSRMVPEKVTAFSKSHSAASAGMETIWRLAAANMEQATRIAASGRVPNASEWSQMSSRSMQMATAGMTTAGKALAPIHRTATGNARRLSR